MRNTFHRGRKNQQGAALFMALIFLIVITMLSLVSMRSSVMELRMAGNAEAHVYAKQRAQAIIDATVANSSNTPVVGAVGETTCLPGASGCTRTTITLADNAEFQGDLDAGYLDVEVKRLEPLEKPAPRAAGYSGRTFSVATFQVSGSFDGTTGGLGNAEIVEGVMVLINR